MMPTGLKWLTRNLHQVGGNPQHPSSLLRFWLSIAMHPQIVGISLWVYITGQLLVNEIPVVPVYGISLSQHKIGDFQLPFYPFMQDRHKKNSCSLFQ